jgi:hypothetical protein
MTLSVFSCYNCQVPAALHHLGRVLCAFWLQMSRQPAALNAAVTAALTAVRAAMGKPA